MRNFSSIGLARNGNLNHLCYFCFKSIETIFERIVLRKITTGFAGSKTIQPDIPTTKEEKRSYRYYGCWKPISLRVWQFAVSRQNICFSLVHSCF